MPIYTKTPNGWEAIAQDAKAVSSFGSIVPDGNQTDEGTYTDADGREWVWYEWAAAGDYSATLTGGLYWVLAVGGASTGYSTTTYTDRGQPGQVNEGLWEFGPGTHPIEVGKDGVSGDLGTRKNMARPSSIGDYGTQGLVAWGDGGTGRGGEGYGDSVGYKSSITGDELEYAPGSGGPKRPGRAGLTGTLQGEAGCLIIATVVNGGKPKPVQPALTPATIVSAPVKVSGNSDPVEWFVKQTDGARKKITALLGNTGLNEGQQWEAATYEVTLTPGALQGILVGGGGMGGVAYKSSNEAGGGGGAGGVIGLGANQPVILPRQEDTTYVISVASTTDGHKSQTTTMSAMSSTIAVQGQAAFAAAMGGGFGGGSSGQAASQAGDGASGGGGRGYSNYESMWNGRGIPGQGHDGGTSGTNVSFAGGGGGYGGSPVEREGRWCDGGVGFNLKDSLSLDGTDAATVAFLAAVTVDGFIAGGGAAYGSAHDGVATGGGGFANVNKTPAKDYTGGGGGGYSSGFSQPAQYGGAGMVLLIEDV